MKRYLLSLMAIVATSGVWQGAVAGEVAVGLYFSYEDWELVCDNTRTCRAAGYHDEGDEQAVSVLLTREAGPGTTVSAQVQIGSYLDEEELAALASVKELSMQIDGRPLGPVALSDTTGELSAEQVAALLAVLPKSSTIEWRGGGQRWRLSDRGAAAVLLKMDDFQGRLGTPGALIRKGEDDEAGVLPPLPVPVVEAAPLAPARPRDVFFQSLHADAVLEVLRATGLEEDCPDLYEDGVELSVGRLTEERLLASTPCIGGAYNFSSVYWLIGNQPPYEPVLVTAEGEGDSDAGRVIFASFKGRGLGDCWSMDEWIWDGEAFVHSKSEMTGMCRLVAPGGPWSLPTVVTEVHGLPREAAQPSEAAGEQLQAISARRDDAEGVANIRRAVQEGILRFFPEAAEHEIQVSFFDGYRGVKGEVAADYVTFWLPEAVLGEIRLASLEYEQRLMVGEALTNAMPMPFDACAVLEFAADRDGVEGGAGSDAGGRGQMVVLDFFVEC